MDWFERITGFREDGYDTTRAQLSVVDGRLHSRLSARTCAVGQLETPSLAELRLRAAGLVSGSGPMRVSCVQGDVRRMHADRGNAGALFQVASQFNLLEMVSEAVTPEQGVTRYERDATQGPACAIAAGAGTIYRNYFAPVDGQSGQREGRQIDCLFDIGTALGNVQGGLWQSDCYIVMLTARTEEIDKLIGLSVGADDYLTKPFSPRELLARIQAMLRRPRASTASPRPAQEGEARIFGALSIHAAGREVQLDGVAVALTRTEFDVLEALSARPKLAFSRRALIDAVWDQTWVGDEHLVDVHVGHLRRKLGDDPSSPRYVRTIRGVGYRMGKGT